MAVPVPVAAASVVASIPLLWWALSGGRATTASTQSILGGDAASTDMRRVMLAHDASSRAVRPMVRRLARRARRFTPNGVMDSIERRVLLAGAPPAWRVERVLAAKLVLGALGLALGLVVFVAGPSPAKLALVVGAGLLGSFAPDLSLRNRATKRQQQIGLELPDTLDQITISVEAGLGFDAAMSRTARAGKGPLAEELARTLQDSQAGMSRSQALKRLLGRTDVDELRHFVLAIVQAENYGVPVAQVLRVQSAELRVKRRQKAEEKAMKIPIKVLFPLMMCILPCMFIVIVGPAGIRIARSFAGMG